MKYVTDVTQQMQFLKTYGYMPGTVDAYKQPELQTPVWKAFVNAENNAFATPLTGALGTDRNDCRWRRQQDCC